MSGTLGISGVFSGINMEVFVTAAMAQARRPLIRLQSQRSDYQAKSSALADIESRLEDLQNLVEGLSGVGNLRSVASSSTDTDVLGVSAAAGATEGVHDLVINQLASAEKHVHDGVTPTETWTGNVGVASTGEIYVSAEKISDNAGDDYKFVFQFGDETQVTVDLSSYDATGITLDELVSEINTAAAYTAASAVSDAGAYKLRIAAQNVGEGKDLVITDEYSVDMLDSTSDFTQTFAGDVGADAVVGAGDFVYTYNSVTRTRSTTEFSTLGQLRDLINNDSSNPGVTASILKYEGDPDHVYHLVLTGNDAGVDYGITIEASTTLSGFGPGAGNWTETQTARNAQIRVDGYPAADWIERPGNTISDVIPNVTLTLYATGSATINLSRSTSQLSNDLDNLVNIYNGIVGEMATHAGYDTETKTAGPLLGDTALNMMLSDIRSVLTSSVPGYDTAEDTYMLGTQIGIEIDRDGYLSLDHSVLDEALSDNYRDVLALIGALGAGSSDTQFVQFDSATEDTTAGDYEVQVDFDAAGNPTEARIRTLGEDIWRSAGLDPVTGIITGSAGNPEEDMVLTATADSSKSGSAYTQLATVRVKHGLASALNTTLAGYLDDVDGLVAVKNEQYDDAIEGLAERIADELVRLADREERIRAKYARLEATLAQLDSMRGAFQSLLDMVAATNRRNSSN